MPLLARILVTSTVTATVVLIASVVAYLWSSSQPTVYTASTRLVVSSALSAGPGADDMLAAPLIARTWAVLALTRPLLEEAIELGDLPFPPEHLETVLEVTSDADVAYLEVAVTDQDPEVATTAANAVAAVLVDRSARGGVGGSTVLGGGDPVLRVAEPAATPVEPSGPRVFFTTLLAGGAALLLCLVLASGFSYVQGTRVPGLRR